MAFDCTDADHRDLDVFLTRVLDAHQGEQMSRDRAIIVMKHVILAAIEGDSTEFRTCIRLPLEHHALDSHRGQQA